MVDGGDEESSLAGLPVARTREDKAAKRLTKNVVPGFTRSSRPSGCQARYSRATERVATIVLWSVHRHELITDGSVARCGGWGSSWREPCRQVEPLGQLPRINSISGSHPCSTGILSGIRHAAPDQMFNHTRRLCIPAAPQNALSYVCPAETFSWPQG